MPTEAAGQVGPRAARQGSYSREDDSAIVGAVAAAMLRGESKAAGVRAAAELVGRAPTAIEFRIHKVLRQALADALAGGAGIAVPDPTSAPEPAPVPEPTRMPEPIPVPEPSAVPEPSPVPAPVRQTVKARSLPGPVVDAAQAASPKDGDLAFHLGRLPSRLGKQAWGVRDDIALMEAHCARKKLAEIALDLRADAGLLSARIDLLTGLHENGRGLKVARWPRTEVLAALKEQAN